MINLIMQALRVIFSLIDRLLIVVINGSYSLLIKLASFSLVDTNTIKAFNQRIGLILGIFMLFSLAIQLLNYIISPDKFSDKSKGGGKMIINIVLSLFLLATVNFIFELGYSIQYKILQKQIIPQIIFGVKQDDDAIESQGQEVSFYLFSSFVNINDEFSSYCSDVYLNGIDTNCNNFLSSNLDSDNLSSFMDALSKKDASKLLNVGNITATNKGEFIFDYMFLFSTVISVIVILILLGFCLDVSVRIVKLYFYQIIAPIPIIANMIPGKGEETFKKWYKACFTTYLDVFIRLIALFFATYIISIAWTSLKDSLHGHFLLGIFVILGALMFAKQVPQIVQDLTGLKLDGSFSLNPLKKLNDNPFIGGLAGGFAGGVLGAVNSGKAAGAVGRNRFLSSAQGLLTGGARGLVQGSKEKDLRGAFAKGADYSTVGAKKILAAGKTGDTSFLGRNMAKIQKRARMKTEADLIEEQLGSYDKVIKGLDSLDSVAGRELDKVSNSRVISDATYKDSQGRDQTYTSTGETLGAMKARLDQMRSMQSYSPQQISAMEQQIAQMEGSGASQESIQEAKLKLSQMKSAPTSEEISDLESLYNQLYKNEKNLMKSQWKTQYDADASQLDADVASAIHAIESEREENSELYADIDFSYSAVSQDPDHNIKATTDAIKRKRYAVDSSDETRRARNNAKYAEETRNPRPGPMGPMGPGGKKP